MASKNALVVLIVLSLASACCRKNEKESDFEVESAIDDNVATVIQVDWSSDGPAESWVEFGYDEEYGYSTPHSDPSETDHSFHLYGMRSLSTVMYRAVSVVDGDELECFGEIETAGLPSSLPSIEVDLNKTDLQSSERFIRGVVTGASTSIFIVDRLGSIVWYHDLDVDMNDGILVGEMHFSLDPDDEEVLFNAFTSDLEPEVGTSTRLTLDGEILSETNLPLNHHSFIELPDGAIANLSLDIRDWTDPDSGETLQVVGDQILEMAADGTERVAFSTWDWMDPVRNEWWDASIYEDLPDWTHGNSIKYYADTDTYLISLGHVNTILEVSRSTGEVLRDFGPNGDWSVAAGTDPFYYQHDPSWLPNGNLLLVPFNDTHKDSYAAEYSLDPASKTLTSVWKYGQGDGLMVFAQGHAQRMENGNTFFSNGSSGIAMEVTPDGEQAWKLSSGLGTIFMYVRAFDDFYGGDDL